MEIVIKEELKYYIDPLTSEEHEALEQSILAEGCRDALVLWGDILIDGHNRYGICQKHGLPFQTVQNTRFKSMEDVYLWMIDQHLGRRSVSDYQRGVLALRKREILKERRRHRLDEMAKAGSVAHAVEEGEPEAGSDLAEGVAPWEGESSIALGEQPVDQALPAEAEAFNSREALARAARLSSGQVVMIEKIQKQATPELVAALKAGDISLAATAIVSTLPPEEQIAAALAGKDELKQVAKRVREAKRKPRVASTQQDEASAEGDEVFALRKRVSELTEENEGLRQQVEMLRAELAAL